MQLEQIPIDAHIAGARDGYITQPEYLPRLITQWSNMSIKTYFHRHPKELQQLYSLLHIHEDADPLYYEIAEMIFDKTYAYGETDAEETRLLAIPLQDAWSQKLKK